MSEWKGLHNPERHLIVNAARMCTCTRCAERWGVWCGPVYPCRCCLAAEVEALRAQVQAVRELHRNHDDCPNGYEDCAMYGHCRFCGGEYPCATIRVLDGGDA